VCVCDWAKKYFALMLHTAYRVAGFRVNMLNDNTEIALKALCSCLSGPKITL